MAEKKENLSELLNLSNEGKREIIKVLAMKKVMLEIASEEEMSLGALMVVGISMVQEATEALVSAGADFNNVRDEVLDSVEMMLDEQIAPRVEEIKAIAEERSHENSENEEENSI